MKSDTPRWAEYSSGSFDASQATAGIAGLTRSPRPDTGKLKPGQFAKFTAALGVAVVQRSAATAPPLSVRQRQVVILPAAVGAQLRRRKPPVPPSRIRRHTTSTCTPAWLGRPDIPASAMARASLRFFTIPATFRVSTTTRPADLAIAGGRLVMMVVPHVDYAGVKPAPLGVQPLPAVGRVALAMGRFCSGQSALSSLRSCFSPLASALGLSTVVPSEQVAIVPNAHVHAYGWSVLHRRRLLTVLDAETGKPRPRRPIDRDFSDAASKAQVFHHGHPADLGAR